MAERYKRLFSLPANLYTEKSPVIIEAGALTKDNETGRIFAQLKFKNITKNKIKGAAVILTVYNTVGEKLGETEEYNYLDIMCKRDQNFGGKSVVAVSDNTARSFSVKFLKVFFADNTQWEYDGGWDFIPEQEKLGYDADQAAVYYGRFRMNAKYEPFRHKDIWLCTCGAVNGCNEEKCHACSASLTELESTDPDELTFSAAEAYKSKGGIRYEKAIALYDSVSEKFDVAEKIEECKTLIAERDRKAEQQRAADEKRRKKTAIIAASVTVVFVAVVVFFTVAFPAIRYNKADKLHKAGEYDEAISIYTALGDYKESIQLIDDVKLSKADSLIDAEKYDEAYAIFEELEMNDEITEKIYKRAVEKKERKDYKEASILFEQVTFYKDSEEQAAECSYNFAIRLMKAKKYGEAISVFESLNGYKDSKDKAEELTAKNELTLLKAAKIGDIVSFGMYEQDNDKSNGKEKIEWQVLDKKDKKLFLISKYAIDCQEYNNFFADITWEKCSLRKWLNSEFNNSAFSDDEQKMIATINVHADQNPEYGTSPGKATNDKIFLLSIKEAEKYYIDNESRKCAPTEYAKDKGVYTSTTFTTANGEATCWWWLRSPGENQSCAAYVYDVGSVNYIGTAAYTDTELIKSLYNYFDIEYSSEENIGAVRPAMWINLDA